MNRDLRTLPDEALGRALADAWPQDAWPPTPDLVPGVLAAVAGTGGRSPVALGRLPMDRRRRRVLLLAAALLALAAVAAATKLVIDLGAVSIQTIEGQPVGPPTVSGPVPFGEPVTLERAAAIAGFEPLVPEALGPPDRVWVDTGPISFEEDGARVVLAWRPRDDLPAVPGSGWGAILMQFSGSADVAFKFVYEDTGRIEHVIVDGRDAYWTVGPHRLDLLTEEGVVTVQVRGRVLLWNEGDQAMRLETALPMGRAIAIAESL
jgi:hypothetical protein